MDSEDAPQIPPLACTLAGRREWNDDVRRAILAGHREGVATHNQRGLFVVLH